MSQPGSSSHTPTQHVYPGQPMQSIQSTMQGMAFQPQPPVLNIPSLPTQPPAQPLAPGQLPQTGPGPHQQQRPPPLRRNLNTPIIVDCPILVWMLSLNREYTKEEFDQCYELMEKCFPSFDRRAYDPTNASNLRHYLTNMLPLLMMRHRRIPRSKWKDYSTPEGKHWIEQNPDSMSTEKAELSKIGYSLMWESSLCGMAMSQGRQEHVTRIGLGMKLRAIEGKLSLEEYVQSMTHKLTELEIRNITVDPTKESVLRRLSMVLACKTAYANSLNTPIDFRRLEFDIPNRKILADGVPLVGWEFRIFEVRLGVARREGREPGNKKDILVVEEYQCACSFYRGFKEGSKFLFYKATKELEPWVQFINLDQMMKVMPKLTA